VKVALYARVSTSDEKMRQDPEVQLVKLRDFCRARGWEIFQEYVDRKSGADPHRPALERMLADARKRKFDAVVIVRLDRITRSITNLLSIIQDLEAWGVSLVCTDQPIETDSATGRLLIHILAALAEFERELIRERVIDGLEKAKRDGKKIGRPRSSIDIKKALELREKGLSYREIARELKASHATVARILNGTLQNLQG
jgi:putative DNA-invertase from lambdoid prophage Rac